MKVPKIIVVGSSNTDMIIKMDRIPTPGETIIGGDFFMAAGGKGANQAVAAARLGGEVTFVAKVGTDMFGKQAVENFKQEGIDTDFIVEAAEDPSGVALIFVDQKGENSIAVASGANNSLTEQDVSAAQGKLEEADVLLLQLETPLDTVRHAARLAVEKGVKIILNPAPARELDDELLSCITVLTPNETETEILTGIKVEDEQSGQAAAQVLRSRGVTNVVITLGSEGSLVVTEGKSITVPSKKVKAMDTTAAGDCFNGALACALAEGKSLEEAARFANLAGALSATKMGAQPSMPTFAELQTFAGAELA
ncbi:ribokinase [Candidatus Neomarinimicrobiota bacterium]